MSLLNETLYQVWAGEGERLRYAGSANTLKGARRIMTRESCQGQRNTILKMLVEGEYMRVNPYDPNLPAE